MPSTASGIGAVRERNPIRSTCTRCIDACPTDALATPYHLAAERCISYLTIEHRGPIPAELRAPMGDWIFGCDICQDVCPWNRFAETSSETAFHARAGNVNAKLQDIVNLTPELYAERFRHSAMKRAKLAGLQRNARQLLVNLESDSTQ